MNSYISPPDGSRVLTILPSVIHHVLSGRAHMHLYSNQYISQMSLYVFLYKIFTPILQYVLTFGVVKDLL